MILQRSALPKRMLAALALGLAAAARAQPIPPPPVVEPPAVERPFASRSVIELLQLLAREKVPHEIHLEINMSCLGAQCSVMPKPNFKFPKPPPPREEPNPLTR